VIALFASGCGSIPVIWVGDDGSTWQRVEVPDLDLPDLGEPAQWSIADLTTSDDGFVGIVVSPYPPLVRGVGSADGLAWKVENLSILEEADEASTPIPSLLCEVAAHPAGDATFLVMRLCDDVDPMVWVSWDDAVWHPVTLAGRDQFGALGSEEGPCATGGWEHATVIPDGDGFVFVGCGAWRWTPDSAGSSVPGE
jgi:hypothetical protein